MQKKSRTVFITGASSGIGKTAALLFANKGWQVAATMRSPNATPFVNGSSHPLIRTYRLDVTDQSSIEAAVAAAEEELGQVDVLVNNAGYGLVGPFEAQTDEQIRRQFDTNVFGMMNVTRAVLPQMRARKAGRIVNVASICGRMTLPLYTAYCSTKWAVEGFSEALAFEVSQFNIKVKIIEPGVFRTEFFDRSQELARKADLTDYDSFVGTVQPNLEGWEKAAPPPDAVARAIWSAANDRLPRLRYSPRGAAVAGGTPLRPGGALCEGRAALTRRLVIRNPSRCSSARGAYNEVPSKERFERAQPLVGVMLTGRPTMVTISSQTSTGAWRRA